MSDLRKAIIKLAHGKPKYRKHLLPLVREAKNPLDEFLNQEEEQDQKDTKSDKQASMLLRRAVIHLAYNEPEMRPDLVPLLKRIAKNPLDEFLEQDKDLNNPEATNPLDEFLEQEEEHKNKAGSKGPSYMSVSHLKQMAAQAMVMLRHVDANKELDDWMESHITEAASKLDDVYHKMMFPAKSGKVADDKFEDVVKNFDEDDIEEIMAHGIE